MFGGWACVANDELAAVESCGKFVEIKSGGCHFLGCSFLGFGMSFLLLCAMLMQRRSAKHVLSANIPHTRKPPSASPAPRDMSRPPRASTIARHAGRKPTAAIPAPLAYRARTGALPRIAQHQSANCARPGPLRTSESPARPARSALFDRLLGDCAAYSVKKISTRIQQIAVKCETKTADDVFVTVQVSVQMEVMKDHAYDAIYKLTNASEQIDSYVANVIRGELPKMKLDDIFTQKEELAKACRTDVEAKMKEFGYYIHNVLVTDIEPASVVKAAMNEKDANRRLREAAADKGEADKTIT